MINYTSQTVDYGEVCERLMNRVCERLMNRIKELEREKLELKKRLEYIEYLARGMIHRDLIKEKEE